MDVSIGPQPSPFYFLVATLGRLSRRHVAGVARLVDDQFQTRDRISSAYEIMQSAARQHRPLTAMEEALTRDAASCLSRIELKKVRLPFWWKWGTWVTAAAIIAGCGLGIAAFNWRYDIQSAATQYAWQTGRTLATVSHQLADWQPQAVPAKPEAPPKAADGFSKAALAVGEQARLLAAESTVDTSLKTIGKAVSAVAGAGPALNSFNVLLARAANRLEQAAEDPAGPDAAVTVASQDLKAAVALVNRANDTALAEIAKPLQRVATGLDASVASKDPAGALAALKQAAADLRAIAEALGGPDAAAAAPFYATAPFASLSSSLRYSGEILDIPEVGADIVAASGSIEKLAVIPERVPGDPAVASRYFSALAKDTSLPDWIKTPPRPAPSPTPAPPKATPSPTPATGLTCPAVTAQK